MFLCADFMIVSYTLAESDLGRTVYSILRRELRISAALTRRLKAASAVYVSGAPAYTNHRPMPGETVAADITAAEPPCGIIPQQGPLDVLYENEGLLALNKPVGIIVHPSRSRYTGTLSNFIAGYLGAGHSCHAVNRLDRDTSGVVLFAKNSYMKALASTALADAAAVREYLALVHGAMPGRGVIDAPIKRLEERNLLRVTAEDGQRAVTHFETACVFEADAGRYSLVRLRLETGRTHQIRVHCLHIGHPVLGDKMYCTEESAAMSHALGIATQALHAQRLAFTDPLSGERLEITGPTPDDW